jgi:AAA domain/Toprim-like
LQRRPNGQGGWWSGAGNRKVLYRWPDLKKVAHNTVFVCEGEKDADRLASHNFLAVTVASGAWSEEAIMALAGYECLILEDNDAPGRKKALKAAEALHGVAASVRIVRIPGLGEGEDVSDWLDHGGDYNRLLSMGAEAPEWQPPSDKPEGDGQVRFPLLPFDQLKPGTARNYLVKGVLPRVGLCVAWGPPKCGKSFWFFDLLLHVALGWKYRDKLVQQGVVIYCAFEGAEGFKARAEAFRRKHKLAEDQGVPLYIMPMRMDLVRDHQGLIAAIREQLPEGVHPAAVGLDTLNRSLTGSESSDEDMSAYVNAADAIREAFTCFVGRGATPL